MYGEFGYEVIGVGGYFFEVECSITIYDDPV